MLIELVVRDLGVIEELAVVLGDGMTALTGETGAGKTLVVEAIGLLAGGRADSSLVRPGAEQSIVEGRFEVDGQEVVARRVVPASGRSRAYLNGSACSAAELVAWAGHVVDLHGQHEHQSLLHPTEQRAALDAFGAVDTAALRAARRDVRAADDALAELGGDERSRQRTIDLLRFQVAEIQNANVQDAAEDSALDVEEDLLADSAAHREAAGAAVSALTEEGSAQDFLGTALEAVRGRGPFTDVEARLAGLQAELSDVAAELRTIADAVQEDPVRLDAIRERRQLLRDLQRKYGGDLVAVLDALRAASEELAELEGHEERVRVLQEQRAMAVAELERVEQMVGARRRTAAPLLATKVTEHLGSLAMPGASIEVHVGPGAGEEVTFLLTANAGMPAAPLAKAASGGELARTMLALRLVLTQGPPLLVFDEVDAGVGGAAAQAVGAALARVALAHQVLVVTHLPQVAAAAAHHLLVEKLDGGETVRTSVRALNGDERVLEVSRMLAGQPDSTAAQAHARELLGSAAANAAADAT